jgi:hypothetical protein
MIAIVCVSNNREILNECLLKGLRGQTAKYELIVVENARGEFGSAAAALNHGAMQAHGKYIMFVHQDIDLSLPTWLEDAERILDTIPDLGVAGVAGVKDRYSVLSNIVHCTPPKPVGQDTLRAPAPVQTLDECLLIVPRAVFERAGFDEAVCDDWHLYGVDYCLSCKRSGLGVYVLPLTLYHMTFSTTAATQDITSRTISELGSFPAALPPGYYRTLKKLLSKHRKDYGIIYTTCGIWRTRYPVWSQRLWLIVEAMVKYPFRKIMHQSP